MDNTKARQTVRQGLNCGALPKDFEVTFLSLGCPPPNTNCAGCGEAFPSPYRDAVAHRRSETRYWFHRDCEKLWKEERVSRVYVKLPLRDHPQFIFTSYLSWPPIWVQTRTLSKTIRGEVGVFTGTRLYEQTPTRLFVKMELAQEPYLGCLLTQDAVFCHQLHSFLQKYIGLTIKEIGNLDLSHTL